MIGKLWRSVSGHEADDQRPARPVLPSIPRDLAKPRPGPTLPAWDEDGTEPSETRTAPRFVPLRTTTTLESASGKRIRARIINMSRTGVAVEADVGTIDVADIALVGTRPVLPGRRIALGAVFRFKKPLDPKLCDVSIVL